MIEKEKLKRIVKSTLSGKGDFADIFVENKIANILKLDDGRIEKAAHGRSKGVGVRVIFGGVEGYAYVDGFGEKDIINAAKTAGSISQKNSNGSKDFNVKEQKPQVIHNIKLFPDSVEVDEKAKIVFIVEETARATGKEIVQVSVVYSDVFQKIQVIDAEGFYAEDERVLTRLGVMVVARKGEVVQTATESIAGQRGFEVFDGQRPEEMAKRAAERAILMLEASPAPTGKMPVVLESGFGGVLFHEACGHGLEADLVQRGASVYKDKIGQKVASSLVTAIDSSLIANGWGSFCFDDEGSLAQETILIEEGILKGFLHSKLTAVKAGCLSTGNGRRQSYRSLPIPRMTNTYIAEGNFEFDEMIGSIKKGLYAKTLGGGQVDPATGDFVFGVSEGYLIENGKISTPVRGATLVGNGPDILEKIDMVGRNIEIKPGTCGKEDQEVPVGCGQPQLRISELVVGGTET